MVHRRGRIDGGRRRGRNSWWRRTSHAHAVRCSPARAARRMGREERREGSRGLPEQEGEELGSARGELSRTLAQQRAAQQGGEARMTASGHVGSDVTVHVASQH